MIVALAIACALSIAAAGLLFHWTLRMRAEFRGSWMQMDTRCDALEKRFEAFDQGRREQSEWAAQGESLHLNKHGQVLRLHRRGDPAADIARSLQMALGEVALIIKIFEMNRAQGSDGSSMHKTFNRSAVNNS